MNHTDLTKAIRQKTKVPATQANAVLLALGDLVKESITGDGEIRVLGLGKFKVKKVKPQKRRNPKTGESIQSKARFKIMFFPTSDLAKYCKEVAKQ